VAGAGQEIRTRPFQLVTGRVWRGSAFGGVRGRTELPGMVEQAMRGEIQLDPFITHTMPLEDINEAFDLMHEGKSIRSDAGGPGPDGGSARMKQLEDRASFGGRQQVWEHASDTLGCAMRFGVYLPPAVSKRPCPTVYFLSGLTCTEQNFITKSGAQRAAADLGLVIVAPDTSPRGTRSRTRTAMTSERALAST
jgi:hypothetical protein